MKDFKAMTKKTTPKKILAGAATVVALSGFVPAINAASPTDTANVGVSVVIQQAITINVGAPVNFGTIILSNTTVFGTIFMRAIDNLETIGLVDEATLVGGHAMGTMAINSSAGAVNIAVGAEPTDNGGNIAYKGLRFGGSAAAVDLWVYGNSDKDFSLAGSIFDIGGKIQFIAKPTPGTYNTKSFAVTVTDI